MRNGKILAEGEPQALLNQFNCSNIENMFLLLSKRQKDGTLSISSQQNNYKCIYNVDELEVSYHQLPFQATRNRP